MQLELSLTMNRNHECDPCLKLFILVYKFYNPKKHFSILLPHSTFCMAFTRQKMDAALFYSGCKQIFLNGFTCTIFLLHKKLKSFNLFLHPKKWAAITYIGPLQKHLPTPPPPPQRSGWSLSSNSLMACLQCHLCMNKLTLLVHGSIW